MKYLKNAIALLLAIAFIAPAAALPSYRLEGTYPDNAPIVTPDFDGNGENSGEVLPPNEPNEPNAPNEPNEPTPEPEPEPIIAQYIKCTGESVNLRSGAGT